MKSKSKSGIFTALAIAVLLVHACAFLSSCSNSGTSKKEKYDGPILKMTLQVDLGTVASQSSTSDNEMILNNAVKVLRKRMKSIAIDSPVIEIADSEKGFINMELPADYVPENIYQFVGQCGNLEFYETYKNTELESNIKRITDQCSSIEGYEQFKTMLANASPGYSDLGYVNTIAEVEAVNAFMNNEAVKAVIPCDFLLRWSANPEYEYDYEKGEEMYIYHSYTLKTANGRAAMDGNCVTDAEVLYNDEYCSYEISIEMNREGANDLYNLTKHNIGRAIAVVLDDEVYMAPVVNDAISGGRSTVTGNFDEKEAQRLAIILKSGSIGAPIRIISTDVVDPE